jgi:hypothetical protein
MGDSRDNVTRVFPVGNPPVVLVTTDLYAESIRDVLKREYGPLRNATKLLGRICGVSHRTAQNWLEGKNAPQGSALLNLMANCEAVDKEMARLKSLARKESI